MNNVLSLIEDTLDKFKDDYLARPNLLLTEEDARCYLYNLLLHANTFFSTPKLTEDKSTTIPLHTEVRWYGVENKLKKRSDIVILDPSDLITKDYLNVKIHSKGFSFDDYFAIIEIKMRRINGGSDNKYFAAIQSDLEKLNELLEEGRRFNTIEVPAYYLICLDKKGSIKERVENLVRENGNNIKLLYINHADI